MIPLRVVTKETAPPDIAKRRLPRMMRDVYTHVGETWQRKMLRNHFKSAARFIYNHQRRTWKYIQHKIRAARRGKVQGGGRIDNVYSGLLRKLMTRRHIVRGYPTRATIKMVGPSYITMRPRDPKKPNKARELLTITPGEERQLDQAAESRFQHLYQAIRDTRTKTTG